MKKGTVKWFNSEKGYGFIVQDDGSQDIFIHISEVEKAGLRSLKDGQKISYEAQENRGRQSACNIALID